MAKKRFQPLISLDELNAICGRICADLKVRVCGRYSELHPYDGTEAGLLEQMFFDEWRAESYWSMARCVEGLICQLGPRQRKSELGLEYARLLEEFRQMVDRYDDLYFRELRQLLFHREAIERRLQLQGDRAERDEMAVSDFCVTMQSSI